MIEYKILFIEHVAHVCYDETNYKRSCMLLGKTFFHFENHYFLRENAIGFIIVSFVGLFFTEKGNNIS